MKKFKKIICILLVFVSLCMNGCNKRFQKSLQEEKRIADSFVPEVDGYDFEIKLKSSFASLEEAEQCGYIETDDYFPVEYKGEKVFLWFAETARYDDEGHYIGFRFTLRIDFPNLESEHKHIEVDITNENQHLDFFDILKGRYVYYDEKIFLITGAAGGYGDTYNGPPALYLLDFEAGKILYVGYFDEYFDMMKDRGYNSAIPLSGLYVKIEKKTNKN